MRRVILQKPIGYCFGVISALEKAKEVKKQYPNSNIYVFGELVHNSFVIEKLK